MSVCRLNYTYLGLVLQRCMIFDWHLCRDFTLERTHTITFWKTNCQGLDTVRVGLQKLQWLHMTTPPSALIWICNVNTTVKNIHIQYSQLFSCQNIFFCFISIFSAHICLFIARILISHNAFLCVFLFHWFVLSEYITKLETENCLFLLHIFCTLLKSRFMIQSVFIMGVCHSTSRVSILQKNKSDKTTICIGHTPSFYFTIFVILPLSPLKYSAFLSILCLLP